MEIHYKFVEFIWPCQSIVLLKRLIWRRAYGRCRRKFLVFRTFLFSFQNWRLNNQMLTCQMLTCQMLVLRGRIGEPIIESFELVFYFSSHYAIIGNVWWILRQNDYHWFGNSTKYDQSSLFVILRTHWHIWRSQRNWTPLYYLFYFSLRVIAKWYQDCFHLSGIL